MASHGAIWCPTGPQHRPDTEARAVEPHGRPGRGVLMVGDGEGLEQK